MTTVAIKKAVKLAIREELRDHRNELREIVVEVFEDIALARAIEQGLKTKLVPRATVMRTLKGRR